jgi:O-antigen/teichoic acid export membrane protein
MHERRELLKQVPHYLGGRVALLLLGFVSFPLFTRIFSVAQYGQLNLVLKVAALVTVLSKCGMTESVFRFYEEKAVSQQRDALRRFYSTIVLGMVLLSASIAFLFVAALHLIPVLLIEPSTRLAYSCAAVLIFSRTVYLIGLNFIRAEGRSATYNVLVVVAKLLTITAVLAIFFVWSRDISAFVVGSAIAEGTVAAYFLASLLRRKLCTFRLFTPSILRAALAFGVPLIVYEFASVVLDSGGRFLIQYFLGSEALGYYAAAYNIANYIFEIFAVPLAAAAVPLFLKMWANKGEHDTAAFLSQTINYFAVASIGVVATTIATAEDAVRLMASSRYLPAAPLVPVLASGLMIYAFHMFLNVPLYIHKRTVASATVVVIATAVNLCLSAVLLPTVGLMGAAVATLASYAVLVGMIYLQTRKLMTLTFWIALLVKCLGIGFLAVILVGYVHTPLALTTFLVKGTLCISLYFGLVVVMDRRFRQGLRHGLSEWRMSGEQLPVAERAR